AVGEGRAPVKALVAAGEFHFFVFVGGAGADDGDDGDQTIYVADVAHFAEGDHGVAFNVVDGAGVAVGDEVPDAGVSPGLEGFDGVHVEVGGGVAFGGGEGGHELVDGLAGEDEAAGVHFGIAGEAVEEFGHLKGAAVGLFLEGEVAAFLGDGNGFGEFADVG